MGVLLLNNYGKYVARRRAIELGLVLLGHPARDPDRRRAAQPAPHGRRRQRAARRPVGADVARRGRRRDRVPRRRVLRHRRDLGAGPAPGGHPGRRPRPRVRRAEHAHLGREHPADHHRRPDRRHRRHARPVILVGRGARARLRAGLDHHPRPDPARRGPRPRSRRSCPGSQLDPTRREPAGQPRDPHGHSHREAHLHGEPHEPTATVPTRARPAR